MTTFIERLQSHTALARRRSATATTLEQVHHAFAKHPTKDLFHEANVTIYVVGSLARGEMGSLSDLDLFLLTTTPAHQRSRLIDTEILASAIDINRTLDFEPFSNDGQYLKIHSLDSMLAALGAPQDDSENLFTARMLLLLESSCAFNESVYRQAIKDVLAHYFRDNRGKASFRPLFLLNDVLRYWRTLCLNYELTRDDPEKPWRKKNINLKFSRMLTIFGTVLPLVAQPISDTAGVAGLARSSPHERFAQGLDTLADSSLLDGYSSFLDDYESFLHWKEQMGGEQQLSEVDDLDKESRAAFGRYADFIHQALTHEHIHPELRRFLIL